MPIIGIAGDSFFAPTQDLPYRSDCENSSGKHFVEILSKKLGYDLVTYARGASSNSLIRLQIQQLVKERVDFVIYGSTSAGRLEFPSKNKTRNYCAELGVYNFNYRDHPDLSSINPNFGENNMESDTISTILGGYGNCTDEQRNAIKEYFNELYDERYRQVQDAYIISSGVQELIDNKIPYLCLFDNFVKLIPYFCKINERIVTDDHTLLPFKYNFYDSETGKDTVRRYHVSDKNQVEIANLLCNYIQTNNLLVWS
jgi:hypothetical protein